MCVDPALENIGWNGGLPILLNSATIVMGVLLERRVQVIFVTASSVKERGKACEIIVESRPLYAVVHLDGSEEKYPIAWEMIYKLAKDRHAENLRLEAQPKGKRARIPRKKMK